MLKGMKSSMWKFTLNIINYKVMYKQQLSFNLIYLQIHVIILMNRVYRWDKMMPSLYCANMFMTHVHISFSFIMTQLTVTMVD